MIDFLKPEETLERNTDSLRDFIISLDKSKADKLRYKVEDNVVKIFITPYKTSISDRDLEFTQGDFNVDAVITLGVHEKTDFDEAIMAHGRILHDATIASINTTTKSEIGAINWVDGKASSLCEMVSDLIVRIDDKLLDPQISTALLTGMVAETDRFGNDKASPHTMSVSGTLMSAGASPQLIASKLEEPEPPIQDAPKKQTDHEEEQQKNPDGMIEIDHSAENKPEPAPEPPKPEEVPHDEIHIDDQGKLRKAREFLDHEPAEFHEQKATSVNPGMVLEPPRFGGQLTSASVPDEEQYAGRPEPYVVHGSTQPSPNEPPREEPRRTEEPQPPPPEPPQAPPEEPRRYDPPPSPPPQEAQQYTPPEPQPPQPQQYEVPPQPPIANVSDNQTLVEIEQAVHSPHVSVFEGPAAPDPALDELSRVARQVAEDADARPYALESMGTTGQLMPDHSDELPGPPPQIIPDHMSPPLEEPAPLPDPTDGPPPPTPPPLSMPPPVV
jgi:hypothetical protein